MKKIIAAVSALALAATMTVTAAAELDLSGYSWDDLIALRAQITHEQMSRDEWQEVEVPQGLWKVGEDIPAGKWTIRCTVGRVTHILVGDKLEYNGTAVDLYESKDGAYAFIYADIPGKEGEMHAFDIELKDGQYVQIEDFSATFTPFTGKPDLGFKSK